PTRRPGNASLRPRDAGGSRGERVVDAPPWGTKRGPGGGGTRLTPPLVSVVMIVRNGERFLASAIRSVLAQDYRPLDVVVGDGQSTDSTVAVAARFPDVRLILQEGRGVADAYNVGIAAARGELVAFLSHDDLWTPDKVSTQVALLQAQPAIQYCVARAKFFLE